MIYALNPKNYTNYIMQNIYIYIKTQEKNLNQNLKLLNYKDLLTEKKP